MDWSEHYPALCNSEPCSSTPVVEFVDVGCGYGGLLDPHFKSKKHKWRIINPQLLSEYAYVLKPEALVYTITDVKDLHEWMVKCLNEHPLYRPVDAKELEEDPVVPLLTDSTEEGQKVTRNKGDKFMAVFRRILDD